MEAYPEQATLLADHQQITGMDVWDFSEAMLLESRMLAFIHNWVHYLLNGPGKGYEPLTDRYGKRLEEARLLLESTLSTCLSIRELSRRVGMNECELKRGFRQQYGLPIHQYIIRARMKQAQQLLHHTDVPVSHVAEQIGYANRGHFAQLYRKYFGRFPHEDRLP